MSICLVLPVSASPSGPFILWDIRGNLHQTFQILCVCAVSIVMGVPSVKREVHSYLTDTLTSLMSELSAAEKDDCVIVVLIAEVSVCELV